MAIDDWDLDTMYADATHAKQCGVEIVSIELADLLELLAEVREHRELEADNQRLLAMGLHAVGDE